MTVLDLREASAEIYVSIDSTAAAEIARLGIASVSPTAGGEWRISGIGKVGSVRLGDVEVRITPKVPLDRLFYLLGRGREWGAWFEQEVRLGEEAEFAPAIAEVFLTWANRVLRRGLLKDYVEVQRAEPTIHGRWLVAEQIRRRRGLPLPAELLYDEYTIDIPANRLVRSAARRLLRVDALPDRVRSGLLRIDAALAGATLLERGADLPWVRFDRRNEAYRPVIALSELILSNGSLDHRVGSTSAAGFLIDLSRVFEQFIEAEVIRACAAYGGTVRPQYISILDRDGHVRIQPDLVWRKDGRVCAIFDAKYKAEKPAGYPNADIYQMVTYCVRHELDRGHLIYAAGNETPRRIVIEEAGIEIVCHAVRLDRSPSEISAQIDRIIADAVPSGF